MSSERECTCYPGAEVEGVEVSMPGTGCPVHDDSRLQPARTPEGEPYDHDCVFRRMMRLVAQAVGVERRENGNYSAQEILRGLERLADAKAENARLRAIERTARALLTAHREHPDSGSAIEPAEAALSRALAAVPTPTEETRDA